LRAAKALGLAGVIAAIDKFWAEGLSAISPSLERFSSGALLTDLQKWLLGSHYEAWAGRTVVFSWDFIFLAARHHRHAGLRDHVRLGHVVLRRGRTDPPEQWRHRRHGLRRHRAVDALVRRVLHGDIGAAEFCAELANGIDRIP
jgi:hypothetical protein